MKGRIALVVGASRGLGAAVAQRLGAAGARVILVARTQGGIEAVDDTIRKSGGEQAVLAPFDITDSEQIDRLGLAIHQRFGKLDAVFSAAAMLGALSPVGHIDPAQWDKVIATNLTAQWRLIRSLDPLLRASDAGRAVFATCAQGREATAYWGAYAISKAALESMVRIYAAETAKTNIRVNLIDPGPFNSRLRALAFPGEPPGALPEPLSLTDPILKLLDPACQQHGELAAPR